MLFSWNPSPLRSSKFSFEYLLLPPRSALKTVPTRFTSKPSTQSSRPLTHHNFYLLWWLSIGITLSAINFQGWLIRLVSCYTLLSGFRLPGPPSCCLYEPTPFMVSDERELWHLISALGSSLIASSAYQKWPTRDTHWAPVPHLRKARVLTNLKFENRSRAAYPRGL